MSELSFLAIAIGGGCGSVARFLVAREMGRWLGNFLPYGTLVVNVLDSLALGSVYGKPFKPSIFQKHFSNNISYPINWKNLKVDWKLIIG